jgi:hypothetical protein
MKNKWLATYDPSSVGDFSLEACAGSVVISVLNPLIAADTVAPYINFNCWVTWKNFEVAEPGTNVKVAVSDNYQTPENDVLYIFESEEPVTFASGGLMGLYGQHPLPFNYPGVGAAIGQVDDTGVFVTVTPSYSASGGEVNGKRISTSRPSTNYSAVGAVEVDLVSGETYILEQDTSFYVGADFVSTSDFIGFCRFVNTSSGENFIIGSWGPVDVFTQFFNVPAGTYTYEEVNFSTFTRKIFASTPLTRLRTQGLDRTEHDASSISTTMGESVRSLRALTRRFTLHTETTTDSFILPGCALSSPRTLRQSYLEIISYLYRFTAGSVRYKIITSDPRFVTLTSNDRRDLSVGASLLDSNAPLHYQDCNLNPVIEVEVPFYSPAENLVMDSQTFDSESNTLSRPVVFGDTKSKHRILQAGGDDLTFTFLVGCPAFIVGPR